MTLKQKIKKQDAEEVATIIATSREVSVAHAPRILLLKPYQDAPTLLFSPPLGLLYLVSALRQKFGSALVVDMVDMKLHRQSPEWLMEKLVAFKPDIVGVSALNFEAYASHRIAAIVGRWNPACVRVLGGPYALHQSVPVFAESHFDWVFEGTADRTFPEAVRRHMVGEDLGTDLPGFSWRKMAASGEEIARHVTDKVDVISDLDALPMPAWDLCEFELYAKRPSFNVFAKPGRYATLFTSRGCPYLCSYCHDIFTKKFKWRSTQSVLDEIEHLYTQYGVREFQIVDDIFNLHKPRLVEIMQEVYRRWPGQLKFSFPNGLRADILDEEAIDALVKAGTYFTALAVETVTPRLQNMIEKYLDIEKTRWAINTFEARGVSVSGFFMLGFPTETAEELEATIRFAIDSGLSLAHFFTVVPQPETPLYAQAAKEGAAQLEIIRQHEMQGGSYHSDLSWYQLTYKIPLVTILRKANWRFYSRPSRAIKLLWRWPKMALLRNVSNILHLLIPGWFKLISRQSPQNLPPAAPSTLGAAD